MPDDKAHFPISPPTEPTTRGRPKKGQKLDPVEAARRVAHMRNMRQSQHDYEAARVETLIHSPLDNLAQFKRIEWEVICRFLADPTLTKPALAKITGYRTESIARLLKKPQVQQTIAAIRAAQVAAIIKGDFGAQAVLKAGQTKAAKKIVETIDSTEAGAKLNLQASESVLDRTGLGKASNVQVHHVHEVLREFTADEMRRYADTGRAPDRFKELFEALEPPVDVTPDR